MQAKQTQHEVQTDDPVQRGGLNVMRSTPVLTGWPLSSKTSLLDSNSRRSPVAASTHTDDVASPFPIGMAPEPSAGGVNSSEHICAHAYGCTYGWAYRVYVCDKKTPIGRTYMTPMRLM